MHAQAQTAPAALLADVARMHACTHAHTHDYMHTQAHTCTHMRAHIHAYTPAGTRTHGPHLQHCWRT